ncbi:hypothetical protein ACHAQH_007390 [Verticillium albo-atrum]
MASSNAYNVPVLVGESNFRAWQLNVTIACEQEDVEEFLANPISAPADAAQRKLWKARRATAMRLLVNSIDPVLLDRLEGAGWDIADRDPHSLWNAVLHVIPKVSEDAVCDLVREIGTLESGDFPTLHAFLARAQTLKRRLCELTGGDSRLYTYLLLNGIRKQCPALFEKHAATTNVQWNDVDEKNTTRYDVPDISLLSSPGPVVVEMDHEGNDGDTIASSNVFASSKTASADESSVKEGPIQPSYAENSSVEAIPTLTAAEANQQLGLLRQRRGLGAEQNGFVSETLASALDILSSQLNSKTTHFILELIQNADDNIYPRGVQPTFTLLLGKHEKDFTFRTDCNEVGFSLKNIDAICSIGKSTKATIVNGQKGFIGEKGIGFKSVFKVANQVDIVSNSYEFQIDRTAHLGMLDPKPFKFPDDQRRDGHTQMLLHLLRDKDHRISDITKGLQQIKPELLLFLRQLTALDIVTPNERCVYTSRRRQDPTHGGETISVSEDRLGASSDERVTTRKLYAIVRHEVRELPLDDRRNGVLRTEITLAFPVDLDLEPQDAFAFLPIDQSGFNFIIQADFLLVANRQALQHELPWNNRLQEAIPDAFVQAIHRFNRANSAPRVGLKYTWPFFLKYKGSKSCSWAEVHKEIQKRLCVENILETQDGDFRAVLPAPWTAGTQQTAAHKPLIAIPLEYRCNGNFIIDATANHGHHLAFGYDNVLEELETLGIKQMTYAGLRSELNDWLERAGCAGLASKSDEWHGQLASALLWRGRSKQKDKLQKLPLVHLTDGSWVSCADVDVFFASTDTFEDMPSDLGFLLVHADASKNPHRRELYEYLGVKKLDAEAVCSLILEKHSAIPRPKRKPHNWIRDIIFLFKHREHLLTTEKRPRWFLVTGNRSVAEHVYVQDEWRFLSQNAGNDLLCHLKQLYQNDQGFFDHNGEIRGALGDIRVLVVNGHVRALAGTALPTIQLLRNCHDLDFVSLPNPQDKAWKFLSTAGVSLVFDSRAALGQLQQIAQRPANSVPQESANELYKKLNNSAEEFQAHIRLRDTQWFVADKPELEKIFMGKVELLDVEPRFRKSLVRAFGLHHRQLSQAVEEEVSWDTRRVDIDHDMTASFRSRAAYFCRLSSNPTAEILARLKKTVVKTVSRITLTRQLVGCGSVRDTSRRHHVQEGDECIVVYHTALTETDLMHLEDDFSSIIVRNCGIEDARWSRLVPFIMRVEPDKIMDFLDKHNVRDDNGRAFEMVEEWEKVKPNVDEVEQAPEGQLTESAMGDQAMDTDSGEADLDRVVGTTGDYGDDGTGFQGNEDLDLDSPFEEGISQEASEVKPEAVARDHSVTPSVPSPSGPDSLSSQNGRRRTRVDEDSRTPKRQRTERTTATPFEDCAGSDAGVDDADTALVDEDDHSAIDSIDAVSSEPSAAGEIPRVFQEPQFPAARKKASVDLSLQDCDANIPIVGACTQ